jgi:hypothetical protein
MGSSMIVYQPIFHGWHISSLNTNILPNHDKELSALVRIILQISESLSWARLTKLSKPQDLNNYLSAYYWMPSKFGMGEI